MRIPDFYRGDTLSLIVVNFYDALGQPMARVGTMHFTLKTTLGATAIAELTTPVDGVTVTVAITATETALMPEGRYLLELRLVGTNDTHVVHSQSIQVRTPLYTGS